MTGPIKVSRSLKELAIKIKEIQREYLIKKGEEISLDKISKILKVSKEEIALAQEAETPLESIDKENYEDERKVETKIAKISNGKDEASLLIDKMCLSNAINDLDEREKQIILLRYYRGRTQSEVAKLLGVTQVQISRIEKKTIKYLREKMVY